MSTQTLAPLREGFYQPKNFNERDKTILATIAKNSIVNVEMVIGAVTQLLSDIKIYKECLIDTINVEAETSDLSMKYANEPQTQPHVLPGVVTTPPHYNFDAIKTDNARMEQLKELSEKAATQKNMYVQIIQEDFKTFAAYFKKVMYSNSTLDQFCLSLDKNINKNY
jgi:Ni,Fe-hydrogenase I large subunit